MDVEGEGEGGDKGGRGGKGDKEKMRKRTAESHNSITLRLLFFAGVGKGEEVEGEGGE